MTVLITGSNKGIGFEIARLFGKNSYASTVIITSRDIANGEKALASLKSEFPNTKYDLHQLDLVSESSRAALVNWVKEKYGSIDVLINNGGFAHKAASTASPHTQATETLAINFYGTKDLTNAIKPLINSRIVTVASMVSRFSFAKLNEEIKKEILATPTESRLVEMGDEFIKLAESNSHAEKYTDSTYGMSKLLIRSLTERQAKNWPDLKVFSGCPGWCKSDMAGWERPPRTAEDGADVFWWLATTDEAEILNDSGSYYEQREKVGWTKV